MSDRFLCYKQGILAPPEKPAVLLVTARNSRRRAWARALGEVSVLVAKDLAEALPMLARVQVAVLGFGRPRTLRALASRVPTIVVAPGLSVREAVQALLQGATDYAAESTLRQSVGRLLPNLEGVARPLGGVVGAHPLTEVLRRVRTVAGTPRTAVLIVGENGTGKEIIGRGIHALSSRAKAPFVMVDCSAIPTHLFESELFGHERGALPGVIAERAGRVELAHRGTLFLDKVGHLPLEIQAKLLRVLQEQQVWRVGAGEPRGADMRVIATSSGDLRGLVAGGKLREDLYYRLKVFQIEVPPLRDRGTDVLHFADLFRRQFNREMERAVRGFSPAAKAKLLRHPFPGNIRELRNVVEEAMVTAQGTELGAESLNLEPPGRAESRSAENESSASGAIRAGEGVWGAGGPQTERDGSAKRDRAREGVSEAIPVSWGPSAFVEVEREAIRRALATAGGNHSRAATLLGIRRQSLVRRLARLGIKAPTRRGRPRA